MGLAAFEFREDRSPKAQKSVPGPWLPVQVVRVMRPEVC